MCARGGVVVAFRTHGSARACMRAGRAFACRFPSLRESRRQSGRLWSSAKRTPNRRDVPENARHCEARSSSCCSCARGVCHCRRRRRASHAPRSGLPPGLDATSTKWRVNVAVVAPYLRAARPGLAVAPEPARHLRADPRQCPRAHALQPYLRTVRSAHRIPASPYARETTSRARSASRV
eukprot:scaffold61685_cov63-Phaeocystis_antarctica.AAC.1